MARHPDQMSREERAAFARDLIIKHIGYDHPFTTEYITGAIRATRNPPLSSNAGNIKKIFKCMVELKYLKALDKDVFMIFDAEKTTSLDKDTVLLKLKANDIASHYDLEKRNETSKSEPSKIRESVKMPVTEIGPGECSIQVNVKGEGFNFNAVKVGSLDEIKIVLDKTSSLIDTMNE